MKPVAFLRNTWSKRKERKVSDSNELDDPSNGRPSSAPAHSGTGGISYGTPRLPIQSPSQFDLSPRQYAGSFSAGKIPVLGASSPTSRRPSTEPAMRRRLHSANSNHDSLSADESGGAVPSPPVVRTKRLPDLPGTSRNISAPRRPPRPPSLKLSLTELTSHALPPVHLAPSIEDDTPLNLQRQGSLRPLRSAVRQMPELDGVWKGFLDDAHEVLHKPISPSSPPDPFTSNPRCQPGTSGSRSVAPRPTSCRNETTARSPSKSHPYYHTTGSISHLPYLKEAQGVPSTHGDEDGSDSQTEDRAGDTTGIPQFSLSLFPAPPPLVIRKRPKPLVLRATPTIAPLPPSPCLSNFSSPDSTPLATPTTPKAFQTLSTQPSPRKTFTPVSILKSPVSRTSRNNPHSPPVTPLLSLPRLKIRAKSHHIHPMTSGLCDSRIQ
ncbi:hypothetical protein BD779DRAFT_1667406 [Infundibulicybe gibba]|nr:hypothetical protein BD779DRAFT_1667406 [Infundibulicybe gibba]